MHNFYLKGLHRSGLFNIKLITFANHYELDAVDLGSYGIDHQLIINNTSFFKRAFWGILRRLHAFSFKSADAGFTSPFSRHKVRQALEHLKESNYHPDVIILAWTQIVLMIDDVRRIFPGVPVVAVEEDVSWLSLKRLAERAQNPLLRLVREKKYRALKVRELEALEASQLAVVNNPKDLKLIQDERRNIPVWEWTPFFCSYLELEHKGGTKDILFYGAMARRENYLTAEWFIVNVMPLLSEDYRFIIVGNRPHKSLMNYASDRVIITGFVDDPRPYFRDALCIAAPLVLGAGVKIKVIESLSAGLPVLTNDIGIEGINAEDGVSYFHCTKPEEYAETIMKLGNGEIDAKKVSAASKDFVRRNYDCDASLKEFADRVRRLACEYGPRS